MDAAATVGSLGSGMYALVTGVIYGALHWAAPLILAALTAAACFRISWCEAEGPSFVIFR